MKKYIFFIFTLVFASTLFAQNEDIIKAKKILDKASEKIASYSTIELDFSFTLENLQIQESESFTGSLISKGDKYKMSIMDFENYFDGNTMWMFMRESNEVNIGDADLLGDEMLNPSKIFSIYNEDIRTLYIGETILNGKTVDMIDLYPENREESYSRIKLYIYRDDLHFARIEQIGRDGTNYFVDIQKMQVNKPYQDNFFIFDTSKYPNIEIVDLR